MDNQPLLTDTAATEVMSLVREVLGARVSGESVFDGDPLGMVLEHDGVEPEYGVWLVDRSINVSMCPGCGAVFICAITSVVTTLHGCVEMMEYLRAGNLSGDPDDLVCTYKRIPVMPVEGRPDHVYVFVGNFWLDFSGSPDRVLHAARVLIAVIDTISEMIDTVDAARRSLN